MSAGLQQDLGLGGEHGCLWEVKERDCWGDPSLSASMLDCQVQA